MGVCNERSFSIHCINVVNCCRINFVLQQRNRIIKIKDMIIFRIMLCFFLLCLINSCSPQPDETPIQLWTPEDREFLIKNLKESRESLLKEIEDLTEYQWNYRVDEDTWSVGLIVASLDCVFHYTFQSVQQHAVRISECRTETRCAALQRRPSVDSSPRATIQEVPSRPSTASKMALGIGRAGA